MPDCGHGNHSTVPFLREVPVLRFSAAFGALCLVAVAVSPALAADSTSPDSWTGAYIGLNANWNFLSSDFSSPAQNQGGFDFPSANYGSQTGNGPGGGIQIGFDYQMNSIVLGMQAITSISGFSSSENTADGSRLGTELTSYGSLNARLEGAHYCTFVPPTYLRDVLLGSATVS